MEYCRPNLRQTLKVWIPYAENDHLTAGSWRSIEGRTNLSVQSGYGEDAIDVGTIDIDVSLTIEPTTLMSLNNVIESPSISARGFLWYFVVRMTASVQRIENGGVQIHLHHLQDE